METEILDNAEMMEQIAQWVLGTRHRTKTWLWCAVFVMLALVLAVRARVNTYWAIAVIAAFWVLVDWTVRRKTQREWQRYEFARQHLRVLLECRKTLQSMSKEERAEIKPEVAKWFLDTFMPGGIEHPVFWEYAEEGVMYPATRRMKLESMGLRRDKNFPNYSEVEYAWDRYGEIDPEREWIGKLRVRGGYIEYPSEKLKEWFETYQKRWNPKSSDRTKENA